MAEATLSLQDVLEEDQELEDTANAVLGDSDDSKCSYLKGYVSRQALYACATCVPVDSEPAGVCLACSLHCHEGHHLYELYTKRNFRCDCGNSKFPEFTCTLNPNKAPVNARNKYGHNFRGLYCSCNRPYPDDEDEVEDEMIQCIICEDWFHSRHLGGEIPSDYEEMACDSCMESHDYLSYYRLHTAPTTVEKEKEEKEVTRSRSCEELEVGASRTTDSSSSPPQTETGQCDDTVVCELQRRKRLAGQCSKFERGAGYFGKKWRHHLCTCPACKEMYDSCKFLLEELDSLPAYEERATRLSSHEAAVSALGSLDHIQQVEAIHHFNELKSELSDFLKDFVQTKRVVSKRDIDDFFEEMQKRKRQRLETGDGVPPANCHF